MQQEAAKKTDGVDEAKAAPEEKKSDKAVAEKKQDSMEIDGETADEEGSKKKKKKGAKEEGTKEKGNYFN